MLESSFRQNQLPYHIHRHLIGGHIVFDALYIAVLNTVCCSIEKGMSPNLSPIHISHLIPNSKNAPSPTPGKTKIPKNPARHTYHLDITPPKPPKTQTKQK